MQIRLLSRRIVSPLSLSLSLSLFVPRFQEEWSSDSLTVASRRR